MKLELAITKIPGINLKPGSLPCENLLIRNLDIDSSKSCFLEKLIHEYKIDADSLLLEVFEKMIGESIINASIVITNGVPSPYDAWTATQDGKHAIYFNLDQWTDVDLAKQTLPILKHEVSHLLLSPFLSTVDVTNFSGRLDRIILDEGIAHFIGYPGDRSRLLRKWHDKWEYAEQEVANAYQILSQLTESNSKERVVLELAVT